MEIQQPALDYFLDNIHEAVATFDHEWRYTYVNRAAVELSGKPAAALLGKTVWEVFPQIIGSVFHTELQRVAAERRHRHFEAHYPHINLWLETDAYPANDGIIVIVRDITDQKRASQELQTKFGQLRRLFELAGAVSHAQEPSEIYRAAVQGLVHAVGADRASVLVLDPDDVMRFKAWIGLSDEYRAAVEEHTPWPLGARDARPIAVADAMQEPSLSAHWQVFAKEGIRALAFIPLMGNGGLIGRFMLYYNTPHEFQTEELQVAQTIATHVACAAGRQRVEQTLRASEQRLALAQRAAHLGIWDRDLRSDAIAISGEYASLYGLPPGRSQLTHQEWLRLVHPDDRERVEALIRDNIERTHVWDAEFRVVWPDGSVHWLLGKGTVFFDDSGQPVRRVGVNLDITEQKQAEAALRESEERFRNMADTAPVMLWVSGPDKRFTFFNKTWLDFTGRTLEQELGDGWAEGVHPEDLERCFASFSSSFDARQDFRIECRLRRADGEYRWVLCTGVPRFAPGGVFAGYIGSDIDITDLKRAQEEAFERQKLESLSVLTGGIAHDFNNLLAAIVVEAGVAQTELAPGSSPVEGLQTIRALALRASEIVRELMIYSGQDKADLEPVDVSRLVGEMLELLKVSISKHARLNANLGKNLPFVRGNAAQIRQIVMNLVINASEAIGEKGGAITVTTSCVTGGSKGAANLPEGDYLQLEVSDTGCGMSEDAQAKIFDPFYTTKFAGRGLGLAVVQGIVRAHGGVANLVSAPGKGTIFQILLPCASQPAQPPPSDTVRASEERSPRAAGTVLLVEDEDTLRLSLAKMLRKQGFSVTEAADGFAAIELIRATQDEIDVILLDMTIPGSSSREVMEAARRIRPETKVILTSAYSREIATHALHTPQIKGFIRKPFQLNDLLQLLRDTLSC